VRFPWITGWNDGTETQRFEDTFLTGQEAGEEIAADLLAVSKIEAVPTLLNVLCEITGMRFAAVARVTAASWTACAVKDDIAFGLTPGDQLDVNSTLCIEVRAARAPIVIEHASADERYRHHHTPQRYGIESYISVPIVLADGRYFGNLCAIDPAPAKLSEPRILSMFTQFARLVALQLDHEFARKQHHAALLDAKAAAELREQFIAILGHDLRNPLQAVYATGDLLERRLTDPVLSGMAARIKVNVRRMSALIDDVADFARGRLGSGIGVRIKPVVDIESGLTGVVQELQDAQPGRTILFDLELANKTMNCDMSRLQQVLSNLIGNAVTHGSPVRPIEVRVRTTEDDLVLTVWNDGAPIPPENIDKIFEPFWRQSTSGDRQGLGLGLHICSQIVRAHEGELSVTSSKEHGTQFTARVPLRAAV
jgi:signal transduction histidine kinase